MNTEGFYISENILEYPGQLAITKLSFPRLFLRFEYDDAGYFASFEEWRENLITLEWLDPGDKPDDESEIDSILTDCWNFLALHEEEEEIQYEQRMWLEEEEEDYL